MVSTELDLTDAEWFKSSYSGGDGGQCLEFTRALAQPQGLVPVRDSKAPNGPALVFPTHNWTAFISAIKQGQFSA
ncbi:DUF397 domain-containing protein [Streptomyces sp. NPDC001739]|uniref:DUF397 domain-containing protein n=1 Tax=Streptomyces sp. NPDC001657 TaxID=3154522 RepID=UPI003316DD75